ncbi:Pentatricopeptide repeat-containing protein [Hibiscus syriacus]|uniref:Pentatricopeptide repeat-containing protein n=1 Tax=Hibiscus syriacus TaxID=106335 RepID=A0A6A3CDR3_HIBSY|nr:Pentatricopeptide repeat-containing protein [Hibiscus syriacus]
MAYKAEQLFRDLESKGFFPDAVTYNSLLYAFAREGNVDKGQHELGLQLYKDMKLSGRNPDVVTYTVFINSLGKANKIKEASNLMSEMLDAGFKPTVRTYSALICGYAKAGMAVEAEETFNCMRRLGIRPDFLAYSVMLYILFRCNEITKAWVMYREMVRDGFTPDHILYEVMLQALRKKSKVEEIKMVVGDMKEICGMNPQTISSFLVKGECYDLAAQMLILGISNGDALDEENLLSILSSYSSSGRHKEACGLLEFLKERFQGPNKLITEALVVVLCEACQIDAALKEYGNARESGLFSRSSTMVNCKMDFPETAHCLINQAESKGFLLNNPVIYVDVIAAYGKVKMWQKAESVVGNVRQRSTVDRKIWNALIQFYAATGCYERARAVFNTMMRDGPSPTLESINGLLEALIVDGRLTEIYVVIQELQDMLYSSDA